MAASLVPLPEIEKLSPRVVRILGGNPGKFQLQGTNTYLLGTSPTRLLLDTGEGKPAWLASLRSVLAAHDITISAAILTHWHPDHVGGVADLLSISPATKIYKNEPTEGQLDIADGQVFQTEGATLRAFHCPGHATDHMALVLAEEDAMFTGDNVLGQGTAVFEDLATYMDSLHRMAAQFGGRAYPGHGPVIEDGKAKVLEYIKHRKEREEQVLAVLEDAGGKGVTSMAIVKVIYKDYPESLWQPAERGVVQILGKLEGEGKVVHDEGEDTWAINRKAAL
ncbi:Metallo-hydrolase/oxidoreductase [Mytilinidion resinicola]|uniref:Metallo-hydrolase/oxidoreductase n=1 Tax=Mytilinidion resinicola TaxID=574789 RepID=A0A6A6Z0A4_9PEZI|nr:Metallo-hydrolase/oxidoreductase [Mytilinidion resinicola]KAF2813694.1 Metallo-hydrolase/oxidoreductase [Mytilinidion resinicola]